MKTASDNFFLSIPFALWRLCFLMKYLGVAGPLTHVPKTFWEYALEDTLDRSFFTALCLSETEADLSKGSCPDWSSCTPYVYWSWW
jgi:hypothetical protein